MLHKKEQRPPSTSLVNFPGPKYQVKRGTISMSALKEQARQLAVELGPDHERVKRMRREIADRETRSKASELKSR